ncbi:MerR family transcriptional regulator [Butyrivibrio sp. XB500-5]|uniref:MerR family transcriptional regulator n=1 Tax=Butyrivibrio sp. XB500-5 TaxID=2364880 RepID=UPI000EA8881A|nr:MerR family transcriptional regulator [Butyrivibrio sp. XB500-5]RKM58616.1 MerR family transcriptional regulator [Butyrivibrio sp. XB500-5]
MVNMEDCVKSLSMDHPLDTTPKYSVTQASKLVEISEHTLRYYDDKDLFPFLQKNTAGKRLFSEADLQWAKLLECLSNSGLSIKEMQKYVKLCTIGDSTVPERFEILKKQEKIVKDQIKEKKKQLKLLQFKLDYYEKWCRRI